jgi:hypothetical protein
VLVVDGLHDTRVARLQALGLEQVQQVLGLVLEAQDRYLRARLAVAERDALDPRARRTGFSLFYHSPYAEFNA